LEKTEKTPNLKQVSRWKTHLILLILLFLATVFLSLNLGFMQIPIQDTFAIVLKNIPGIGNFVTLTPSQIDVQPIIMAIRLPRILTGALVGAALAASGTVFQGLFRNPMADPYTTSASQGAALGAAIAIVLGVGVGTTALGNNALPVFAFLSCIISVLVVYTISRVGSKVPISTLLLSGIAVGIFELAIVAYLQTIAGQKLGPLTFWLIGSLSSSRTTWGGILSILPFIAVGIAITYLYSRDLNLFTLGEDQAQHLGVNLERSKLILMVSGAFMTAAAVSISGLIGFIGLMIPHLTRLLVGPDHRVLLPASVLMGGSFLVLCDGLARVISSPNEIPVGVITAICGVTFFLYLMRRKKKMDAF
jgi:iron complex transport system permease protein